MIFLKKNLGVEILDLEGVNSPQRAFFKAGFGGELKPYYMIKFKKNELVPFIKKTFSIK